MFTIFFFLEDLDATSADAHILMAQIHLQEKNYQQGAQSLEVGLSYNFKIREHPIYHMITAMVQKTSGNLSECINSLKLAMGAAEAKNPVNKNDGKKSEFMLLSHDKVTLYLELIDAYQKNNQTNEAIKIMESAIKEFKGKFNFCLFCLFGYM